MCENKNFLKQKRGETKNKIQHNTNKQTKRKKVKTRQKKKRFYFTDENAKGLCNKYRN